MKALVIQHIESEGVGTLGEFLNNRGWLIETVRLYDGHRLPDRAIDYDLVASMGGPMNVYEEQSYPFLAEETEFLRKGIMAGANILGVCLGAQMIAKACGALVTCSPYKEVGWGDVHLTPAGANDPIFKGVKNPLKVFQWHEDMFNIPADGVLLGCSDLCPHQAFRVNRAYGFQFHVEVDSGILEAWFNGAHESESFLSHYRECSDELKLQSELIYSNLNALISV